MQPHDQGTPPEEHEPIQYHVEARAFAKMRFWAARRSG
jgi:hypothetical protein